jgi:gliding motility-associated-like protein
MKQKCLASLLMIALYLPLSCQITSKYAFFQGDSLQEFINNGTFVSSLQFATSRNLNAGETALYMKKTEEAFIRTKYHLPQPPVSSSRLALPTNTLTTPCNNIDFESGSFPPWTGSIGYNSSSSVPLTVTGLGVNTLGLDSPEPSCSYHTLVTAASGNDPYSGLPMVDPGGGTYAVRLGGETINENHGFSGASSCNGGDSLGSESGGEILQQTFPVTSSNSMFTYNYAVVLFDGSHLSGEQPYFKTEVLDSAGNAIPCLQIYVEATNGTPPAGFLIDAANPSIFYCPWTMNSLNLSAYIGHTVTVRFTAAGCIYGGHFGYAYIDCSCSKVNLNLSATAACTGSTVNITAPPGAAGYQWTRIPAGPGIVGASNAQTVGVNTSGKYEVTISNGTCSYTIDTTLTFLPRPVISASSIDPTCHGVSNGSTSVTVSTGVAPYTYSWSSTPVQTTSSATSLPAGTFTVTVTESNGCLADTVLTLTQPAALSIPSIPPVTICINQSTLLIPPGIPAGGTPPITFAWTIAGVPAVSPVFPITTTTYTVIATDANGCTSSPQFLQVVVNPSLTLSVSGPPPLCPGASGVLQATASGGDGTWNYSWSPATGLSSPNAQNSVVTPATTTIYTLVLTDNCGTPADTQTVLVSVFPSLPVITFSANDTAGCAPLCVNFSGSSAPACATAFWNFGDSSALSSGCGRANHCYTKPGTYPVLYHVTDINGCIDSSGKQAYIHVLPVPVAAFTFTPDPVTFLAPLVQFTNKSQGATSYDWHFGDPLNDSSSSQNPVFTYRDTGCFTVQLIVENASHCFNNVTREVCVHDIFTFYAPDCFTPNGDGLNDFWIPQGNNVDPKSYDLAIFDRWGNRLFATTEWGTGWDGHANLGPVVAQQDTYVWKVTLRDLQGGRHSFIGSIHLIN